MKKEAAAIRTREVRRSPRPARMSSMMIWVTLGKTTTMRVVRTAQSIIPEANQG